jgi:anti-sigma B factor antagonist
MANVVVLAVSGELDIATANEFTDAVDAALTATSKLVLELSGLGFCDSTGLGALVGLYRRAREAGTEVMIAAPRAQVEDVLVLSGVDGLINVYPSLGAAYSALASGDTTAR